MRGPYFAARLPNRGEVEDDVQRPVDDQRRDVRDREVARPEQVERDERMASAPHPEGKRRRRKDAERQDDVADGVLPLTLLAINRAECQASHRERHDPRAHPVELRRRLVVAALRHVLPGRPQCDEHQRHIDKEGGAPGDGVDEQTSDHGPEDGGGARGAGPGSERTALLLTREVRGQERERARHQHRAGRTLEDPEEHEKLRGWRQAAKHRGEAEPHQAVDEHPLTPVVVAERAREDEQGAEGQQVGVVDVRLSFEDTEECSRQVASDTRQSNVDDSRVQEHDA